MKLVKKKDADVYYLNTLKKKDDYVLLDDEIDITSLEILNNSRAWDLNYADKKDAFQYLGKRFNEQNDITKAAIVEYCAIDMSTCITYFISKGYSQERAISMYISNRTNAIIQLSFVCKDNLKNQSLLSTLLQYMSQQHAERFLNETHQLLYNYAEFALYGKKYGNYVNGLLDYIEDYGDFQGTGLSTYVLYPGKNLSDLVSALVILLTNNRSNINL